MRSPIPALPIRQKVLLWLDHVESRGGDTGLDATQVGISNATGLTRGYVSRTMAPLLENGRVVQRPRRLAGFGRALLEYRLTEAGRTEVRELSQTLGTTEVQVRRSGSDLGRMSLLEVWRRFELPRSAWDLVSQLEAYGSIDLEVAGPTPRAGANFARELADAPSGIEIVGRAEELADVSRWIDGPSAVYALEGLGGIGKTTLISHALRTNPPRRHVLWLRLRGTFTGTEVVEQLDRFLAALGRPAPLPAVADPRALYDHLRPRVKGFPLLVVVDDVHKAGAPLGRVLSALVDLARSSSGLFKLVLIGRDVAVPEDPLRDATRRELTPLSEAESERLLAMRGSGREGRPALVKAGGGNPLFLELLARMPDAGSPRADFARSLGRDLAASLSADQWNVLKWVASMRTPASPALLERLGLGSPSLLSDLARASLLVRREDHRFDMHDVVRDALYEQIQYRERRRIHEGLADAFRPSGDDWTGVTEFLHHLMRADRGTEAIRWVMRNRIRLMEQAHAMFAQPAPGPPPRREASP